jgi:hypothetical protein
MVLLGGVFRTSSLLVLLAVGCGRHEGGGGGGDAGDREVTDQWLPDASGDGSSVRDAGRMDSWSDRLACGRLVQGAGQVTLPPSFRFSEPDSCGNHSRLTVLAEVAQGIASTVVDDVHVYFATDGRECSPFESCDNPGGILYRLPRCGGVPEPLTTELRHYAQLVDGGESIYYLTSYRVQGAPWSLLPAVEFGRVRKSDGAVERLESFAPGAFGKIAANGTHAYLLAPQWIYRVAHDSSSVEVVTSFAYEASCAELDSQARATALAVDDTRLVWAAGRSLGQSTLDGADTVELFRSPLPIGGVALSAADTFVSTWAGCTSLVPGTEGEILRLPGESGAGETLVSDTSPKALDRVGAHLYWSDAAGFWRISTEGGAAELVTNDPDTASGAVGTEHVYAGPRAWRLEPLPAASAEPSEPIAPIWSVNASGAELTDIAVDAAGHLVVLAFVSDAGTVGQGSIFRRSYDRTLWALKLNVDGDALWTIPLTDIQASAHRPTVSTCLAVGHDGAILAVNQGSFFPGEGEARAYAPSGAVLWQRSFPAYTNACVFGADGSAYLAVSGGSDPAVIRVERDGAETWRFPLETGASALESVGDGGVLVSTAGPGSIRRIRPDGSCAWEVDLAGLTVTRMNQAGEGRVLIAGDGHPEASFAIGGWEETLPTPNVSAAFIGWMTLDGHVDSVRFFPAVSGPGRNVLVDEVGSLSLLSRAGTGADLRPSSGAGEYPAGPFVAKFEPDGRHHWTRFLDSSPSSSSLALHPNAIVVMTSAGIQGLPR